MSENYLEILNRIKTFVFDVDGVLTDGRFTLMPSGEAVRHMNIKDGYALQLAVKKGYKVGIISGGTSEVVRKRFTRLGIHDVYLGASDKKDTLQEFMLTYDLKGDEMLYMGDDLPDFEAMKMTAFPCCPNDADDEIKQIAKYVSRKDGGKGCVRDVIEKTMRIQEKWFDPNNVESDFELFKW